MSFLSKILGPVGKLLYGAGKSGGGGGGGGSSSAPGSTAPTKGTGSGPQTTQDLFSGFMDDLDQTFVRLGRGRDFRAGVTGKVKALGVTLGS